MTDNDIIKNVILSDWSCMSQSMHERSLRRWGFHWH